MLGVKTVKMYEPSPLGSQIWEGMFYTAALEGTIPNKLHYIIDSFIFVLSEFGVSRFIAKLSSVPVG